MIMSVSLGCVALRWLGNSSGISALQLSLPPLHASCMPGFSSRPRLLLENSKSQKKKKKLLAQAAPFVAVALAPV
jgi:hypothetical protein